jgi:hypothetical protein
LLSGMGELGWIARQLRDDVQYQSGCVQRARGSECIADLVKLNQAIGEARKGADYRRRFPHQLVLKDCVCVILADSGHANGTPETDEIKKYRSVGGHFLLLANKEILQDKKVHISFMDSRSSMTKRVCRSTLAAEASHLAEAVEAADWLIVCLEEAFDPTVDLSEWQDVVNKRQRVYVTDAQSVYDYLQKDGSGHSSDKRMAIEGALLKETIRRPLASVRWIDGLQNISDILTKALADKTYFRIVLKEAMFTLVQDKYSADVKEKKKKQRDARKAVVKDSGIKDAAKAARRQQLAAEVGTEDG